MRYTILNRTGRISLFKRGLHEVILAPGDRLVLGYGYLYENVITNMDDDGTKLNDKNKDSAFIKEFRKWVNSNNNSEKERVERNGFIASHTGKTFCKSIHRAEN